ncbi:hypothetical protein LBMAG36_06510 [Chlorobiota bacterium]|nr:hypothetical protein LBMAG36_06510 [Chlorobiota bacterium]
MQRKHCFIPIILDLIMMTFFEQNALYVVLLITLTVWVGIAFYLQALDKKVSALEKKINP